MADIEGRVIAWQIAEGWLRLETCAVWLGRPGVDRRDWGLRARSEEG
jgi:hypothetical protein